MAKTDFSKRFRELVAGLTDTELGFVLGVTADAARKLRNGDIKSLKLHAALRLARELQVSPWYLAGEPEPAIATHETKTQRLPRQSKTTPLGRPASEQPLLEELSQLRARIFRLELAVKNRLPR